MQKMYIYFFIKFYKKKYLIKYFKIYNKTCKNIVYNYSFIISNMLLYYLFI